MGTISNFTVRRESVYLEMLSAVAGRTFSFSPGDVVLWENEIEAQAAVDRSLAVPLTESGAIKLARQKGLAIRVHKQPLSPAEQTIALGGPSRVKKNGIMPPEK
jgi:hypothetical protein